MKNNTPGRSPKLFVAAIAPNIGGIAPGIAPTKTAQGEILFIGVYIKTYETYAKSPSKAEETLIRNSKYVPIAKEIITTK